MKTKSFLIPIIGVLALTSCASGVKHELSEYVLQTNYKSDYRILHLTDTHISDKDNQDLHYEFMDLTIKEANPDMIIVTGDLFTLASKTTAKRFFNYLNSFNVPWSVTFGNHDEQVFFSIDWMTDYLNNYGGNCLFKDLQDDNLMGNDNFVINLMKDDKVFEQLYLIDSNRYYYGGYNGYDYIKPEQIQWYSDMVDYTTAQNGGTVVPSMLFYHIPLPEIDDAWNKANDGSGEATLIYGEKREASCPPKYNSGFFDKIVEKNSTTHMFFGHDHINNFIVNYKGVDFAYGIKANNRIYADEDMMGGRVIILHDDHSVSYEHIYHTYAEVK